ncbi:MAG: MMPL family transporter, partial [Actinobacteria bacterium]|nr:MMPL family transporter [Actinomycetota bacterium]
MKIGTRLANFSVKHPWIVVAVMVGATVLLGLGAGLPSLWPATFKALNPLKVDTDPENMLPANEPVRVYHNQMRRELALYDMVVVGIVNESHPDGVFNVDSLRRIYELTEFAKTLRWDDPENPDQQIGVVTSDMIGLSTVDNIEPGGLGIVKFEWLMPKPPQTAEEARAIRDKALRIPFLRNTVVSEDGKAVCLYLPLTSKDLSHRVYTELRKEIAKSKYKGDDQYHIAGLPVAEDTFGVEMFKQMAISAPIAMLVIFLLLLVFFRKLALIISPLIVAMVSVIWTMSLLVISGYTVHIMSSMIPIFIMPIAVLDSVHILSEFFDRYRKTKDRRATITGVMETLFTPMLYTSLTTIAGFASLALTPIPPVQVFGLFVGLGVAVAWVWTVMFIPAYVMLISNKSLENFGAEHETTESEYKRGVLPWIGRLTVKQAKPVMAVTGVVIIIAAWGITQININDNPTKWFKKSHPIRVADTVINKHLGGTYMAYLGLEAQEVKQSAAEYAKGLTKRLQDWVGQQKESNPAIPGMAKTLQNEIDKLAQTANSGQALLEKLKSSVQTQLENASDEAYWSWEAVSTFVYSQELRSQVFKQPEALRYIEALQKELQKIAVVGKSNSLADIVKTVHREFMEGDPSKEVIPATAKGVGEMLIQYQSSHRPGDLWHFVTPDYKKSIIWVQLKSGDNQDMQKVVAAVNDYMQVNRPPMNIKHNWFGLTYINVIWQEKMVSGMLQSFLGSFLVVLLMMTFLFRSALWGLLSMIPLIVTIGLIYGLIGIVGKDYDMPVAVLSSLSLGLAVDYAIHFLARGRQLHDKYGSWQKAVGPVFAEPARAISRNVVVVGVGFLPLIAASLVPYKTVGIFIAGILVTAGVATLVILPAMISLLERWLFPATKARAFTCKCGTCVISAVVLVAVVVINVHQFMDVGWTKLTWFSIVAIPILAGVCALASRRGS